MTKPITGYIYFSERKQNSVGHYAIGDLIKNDTREPPYIVVDHHIEKIICSDWPGTLYEVAVVDPVTNDEMKIRGPGAKLKPDAGYTRAVAIRILKILDSAVLFGNDGKAVCDLLNWIRAMDYVQAEKLGNNIDPLAYELYTKAWNAWLVTIAPDSYHLEQEHKYTLAIPTQGHNPDSPINKGFLLISNLLSKRAQQVSGDAAMVDIEHDESDDEENDWEDEPEKVLAPIWEKARDALLHAAMGMGARRWISETDCEMLTSAWNKTVNLDEPKK